MEMWTKKKHESMKAFANSAAETHSFPGGGNQVRILMNEFCVNGTFWAITDSALVDIIYIQPWAFLKISIQSVYAEYHQSSPRVRMRPGFLRVAVCVRLSAACHCSIFSAILRYRYIKNFFFLVHSILSNLHGKYTIPYIFVVSVERELRDT